MCGFSGWLGSSVPQKRLVNSLARLYFRGPDQQNIIQSDTFGFAHARLSIRDASNGVQPYFELGSNFILLFNGEIFNIAFLKELLLERGIVCTTNCDTEIVYKLFIIFRYDSFALLDGQFSIAFYDTEKKELILSRDIYGEKPLFFQEARENIFFGSSIESINALTEISPSFSEESIVPSALFWSNLPSKTNFKGIKSVVPGSYLIFRDLRLSKEVSFNIIDPSLDSDGTMSAEELDDLLHQSVRERLIADREVGIYLSGGLDSSAIAQYIRNIKSNQAIKSFGISFESREFDESLDQELVADYLNLTHLKAFESLDLNLVNEAIGVYQSESCSHRLGFAPFYSLSKLAKESDVSVILTGEGADELLFGYDHYREYLLVNSHSKIHDTQIKDVLSQINSYVPSHINRDRYIRYKYNELLSSKNSYVIDHIIKSRMPTYFSLAPLLKFDPSKLLNDAQDQWKDYLNNRYPGFTEVLMSSNKSHQWRRAFDIETLLSGHLLRDQGDRPSMYNSVETRAPFLSKRLLEGVQRHFDISISSENTYFDKKILRQAMKNKLPEQIVGKKKFPFRTPDNKASIALQKKIIDLDKDFFNVPAISQYLQGVINSGDANPSISGNIISLIFSANQLIKPTGFNFNCPALKLTGSKFIGVNGSSALFCEYSRC